MKHPDEIPLVALGNNQHQSNIIGPPQNSQTVFYLKAKSCLSAL